MIEIKTNQIEYQRQVINTLSKYEGQSKKFVSEYQTLLSKEDPDLYQMISQDLINA